MNAVMNSVLTNEGLVDAVKKSKATTVSALWRYLGHKSAISGSQGRKIRELVPNINTLFENNLNGVVETPIPAPVLTVKKETTRAKKEVNPAEAEAEAKAKAKYDRLHGFYVDPKTQRERLHGFYTDKICGAFVKAAQDFILRTELWAQIAAQFNKDEKYVRYVYYVLNNDKSRVKIVKNPDNWKSVKFAPR